MYDWITHVHPTVEPVDVATVKLHLRLDAEDFNDLIAENIKAARGMVERYLSRALITQTRKQYFHDFQSVYTLIGQPIASIEAFTYTNENGTPASWAATNYLLDGRRGELVERANAVRPDVDLIERNAIEIIYTCGYGSSPESVPAEIRQAIKMLAGHWIENPSPILIGQMALEPKEMPFAVRELLRPYLVM